MWASYELHRMVYIFFYKELCGGGKNNDVVTCSECFRYLFCGQQRRRWLGFHYHYINHYIILYYIVWSAGFTIHRICKFSQFLNLLSSLPRIQVIICRAFMLARTTLRLLYQCAEWPSRVPCPPQTWNIIGLFEWIKFDLAANSPDWWCTPVWGGFAWGCRPAIRRHCDWCRPIPRWISHGTCMPGICRLRKSDATIRFDEFTWAEDQSTNLATRPPAIVPNRFCWPPKWWHANAACPCPWTRWATVRHVWTMICPPPNRQSPERRISPGHPGNDGENDN